MTPEKRLNQLEPLVAEISAQIDRVVAQNRQVVILVSQLAEAITQQSDTIQFLLHEQIQIKTDVAELKTDVAELKTDVAELKTDVAGLKTDVAELKTDVAELKTDVAGLKGEVAELKTDVAGIDRKMDLVLQILQSGNGRG